MLIPPLKIGVYLLYKNTSDGCKLIYAGRSDTDLSRRLCNHPLKNVATHFEYYVCETAEKAYLLELAFFHAKSDLINQIHPAKPNNSEMTCPICGFG